MDNLINDKLTAKRKNKAWLARMTGLDLSVVSRISSGKRNPNLETAHKIAYALDSSIEDTFILPEPVQDKRSIRWK